MVEKARFMACDLHGDALNKQISQIAERTSKKDSQVLGKWCHKVVGEDWAND